MIATAQYDYEVQGYYSGQWETLTAEETAADARAQKKCYDENEPDTPHRVRKVRVIE